MLGGKLHTVRENTEIFVKASKDISLEVNSGNTKYIIASCHQNVIKNENIVGLIENLSIENVEKLK